MNLYKVIYKQYANDEDYFNMSTFVVAESKVDAKRKVESRGLIYNSQFDIESGNAGYVVSVELIFHNVIV